MIARGENARLGMSSAPLVFGKFFDFSFAAHRLHFKPSSTHGSAWLPRNWKWWKTQKAWEWIHTIFQNAITRLLTVCVARTDRLCGITHKLGNAQFGLNSASTKEQGIALSAPEERRYSRRQGRKHRIDWRGPRGAPLTTPQLYTSAVGEHKMSYSRVVCVCVCGRAAECTVFVQHTREYRHKHWRGGCHRKLLKSTKSTFAAKILYFSLCKPIDGDINILRVCPCQAVDLNYFCSIYFLFPFRKLELELVVAALTQLSSNLSTSLHFRYG